jgi:hypothetical protein
MAKWKFQTGYLIADKSDGNMSEEAGHDFSLLIKFITKIFLHYENIIVAWLKQTFPYLIKVRKTTTKSAR